MKEIIYNIDGVAGRVITLTGLTDTFTKNNVLGIINKSQGDVLYTPMDWNLLTFAYSNGTMTLTLADSVTAIVAGDKLLVKLYSDSDLTVAQIQNGLAKQGTNASATNTAILAKLSEMDDYLLYGAAVVTNSDNVGTGNQGYTIVLDQTQSVNGDMLNI